MVKQNHHKMNSLFAYRRFSYALGFVLAYAILGACHPYVVKEEKYFLFIHNQGTSLISYSIYFQQAWSDPEQIPAKDFAHVYDFYAEPPIDALPAPIQKIKLITSQCTAIIARKDFEKRIKKDTAASWDIHVTENLLKVLGC